MPVPGAGPEPDLGTAGGKGARGPAAEDVTRLEESAAEGGNRALAGEGGCDPPPAPGGGCGKKRRWLATEGEGSAALDEEA